MFVESGEQTALRIVKDELKIVYERFKTSLADYEVFLSMCCTFYQSVERVSKLVFRANKYKREITRFCMFWDII